MRRPIEFLHKVWSRVCEEGDYVFLCSKPNGKWRDTAFKFDQDIKGRVRDYLRRNNPTEQDVWFCPLPFSQPERQARYVKPVNILWSDIDDGSITKVPPTVLWKSGTPGHHHGLWFINETLHPDDAAAVNRSVTHFIGADKGGWDLSQVLRIPGTFNHKNKRRPNPVILVHWGEKEYNLKSLSKKVKHIRPEDFTHDSGEVNGTLEELLEGHRLSARVKQLLCGPAEEGRRSDMLWYFENKLSEAGYSPAEIIAIIKQTDWNKFKGRHDEDRRLKTEMEKVLEGRMEKPVKRKLQRADGLRIESFDEVMSSLESTPGWAIPGFWMKRSHGLVAGEPKSFKSTLVMDMALSIATGAPFLGKYPVEETGPVLYIQNENAKWIMKDRFEKMVVSKGLGGSVEKKGKKLKIRWPEEIPFYMINQQNFILTDTEMQSYLEVKIKEMKPALVILDPLYLMFDGDIASAQELFPILQWLLYLKNEYNCGIILIHHYNKGGSGKENVRGGQRVLGSTTLHGWVESAWYIQVDPESGDGKASLKLDREFRGAEPHNRLEVELEMGGMGDTKYNINVQDWHQDENNSSPGRGKTVKPESTDDIMNLFNTRKSLTEKYISQNTGFTEQQVRVLVDKLIAEGRLKRHENYVILNEEYKQ